MTINKAQLSILEKAPTILLKRQILSLVTKHNTLIMNKGYISYRPNTEFEELFTSLNKKVLDNIINIIITKDYDVYIDNFSPKELFKFPKLLDYIIKKDASFIEYLDEEYITENHIDLLATRDNTVLYLVNKNKLPEKALNNQKVLDVILTEVSVSKYFELIEIIENKYPNQLSYAINIGIDRGIFNEYTPIMKKYISNQKIIDSIKRINMNDILNIYETEKEKAKEIFMNFIKKDRIHGLYDKKNDKNMSFFDDNEVLHALASSNRLTQLDTFLTRIDVIRFSIKDLIRIIKTLSGELYSKYPKNFFSTYLCLKLSIENKDDNAFIGFDVDLVKRYLLETNNYLYLKNNFNSLLYYINHSSLKPVTNTFLLRDYIHLLKEGLYKDTTYFEVFSNASYTEENIASFIDFINNYNGVLIIPNSIINNENLYRKLLSDCNDPSIILQMKIDNISDKDLDIIIDKIKNSNKNYYHISESFSNNSSFLIKLLENNITKSDLIRFINPNLYTKEIINKLYYCTDVRNLSSLEGIPIDSIFKQIDIKEVEISSLLELPDNEETLVRCLMIISKTKNNKKQLDPIIQKCKKIMLNKGLEEKEINLYIKDIQKGNKDPLTALYIKSQKNLLFTLYIDDFYLDSNSEYIDSIPITILKRINVKHIREIINLLKKYSKKDIIKIALNIYLTIGFERSISLLSSNYGPININKLKNIFNDIDINNIVLKLEGSSYIPDLNEEWIELIFGSSNKVRNTPIRNYLNDYVDKKEELEKNNFEISSNLSLTDEEKKRKIKRNDLLLEKYQQNNEYFISKASEIFNDWDTLKEEYLKSANNSKLKIKMNANKVVELLNGLKALRQIECDEIKDEELLRSDVFEYVGKDNRFSTNSAYIPSRILELSREMDNTKTKKFPNIRISNGEYILKTYNPHDRRILSLGYKYGCCFRANGNADKPIEDYQNPANTINGHSNDSLLRYCCSTEYGGCIEITNVSGKTILFSPILRSGNTLIIHSLERKEDLLPIHYDMLVQYANKVIEDSYKNNDNIDFVLIGDNKIDQRYFKGKLTYDKKFKYYNVNEEFPHMYNNFDINDQLVVAYKKGKKIEDINYGKVKTFYYYPINYYERSCEIDNGLLIMCQELNNLKEQYIILGNKRFMALENNNEKISYELLTQMKKVKKQYLVKYESLLKRKKGIDYYKTINNIIDIVSKLHKEISISDLKNYSEFYYGKDWYVAITKNNIIEFKCLPSGKEAMNSKLKELKKLTNLKLEYSLKASG